MHATQTQTLSCFSIVLIIYLQRHPPVSLTQLTLHHEATVPGVQPRQDLHEGAVLACSRVSAKVASVAWPADFMGAGVSMDGLNRWLVRKDGAHQPCPALAAPVMRRRPKKSAKVLSGTRLQ